MVMPLMSMDQLGECHIANALLSADSLWALSPLWRGSLCKRRTHPSTWQVWAARTQTAQPTCSWMKMTLEGHSWTLPEAQYVPICSLLQHLATF
jgi:hypothetical protein